MQDLTPSMQRKHIYFECLFNNEVHLQVILVAPLTPRSKPNQKSNLCNVLTSQLEVSLCSWWHPIIATMILQMCFPQRFISFQNAINVKFMQEIRATGTLHPFHHHYPPKNTLSAIAISINPLVYTYTACMRCAAYRTNPTHSHFAIVITKFVRNLIWPEMTQVMCNGLYATHGVIIRFRQPHPSFHRAQRNNSNPYSSCCWMEMPLTMFVRSFAMAIN